MIYTFLMIHLLDCLTLSESEARRMTPSTLYIQTLYTNSVNSPTFRPTNLEPWLAEWIC